MEEERFGSVRFIHTAEGAALRRELLESLYADPEGGFLDPGLGERIRTEIRVVEEQVRSLWQRERGSDPRHLETRQWLEAMEAISRLPSDASAASRAANGLGVGLEGGDKLLRDLFEAVLLESC